MRTLSIAAISAFVFSGALVFCASPSVVIASPRLQEDGCEPVHVSGYAPVVTGCGNQVVQRYPLPPTLVDGAWVIEDEGQQFTLVEIMHEHDYAARDDALRFYDQTGIPIRFGWPRPFDDAEESEEIISEYIGVYVSSESVGEWIVFGLPLARIDRRGSGGEGLTTLRSEACPPSLVA